MLVKLKASGTVDKIVVRINDRKVSFVSGKGEAAVKDGKEHPMQWFVRGATGTKYVVEITAPVSAKFKHEATLDDSEKDSGLYWFK